jgi:hypothetical protein
MGQQCNPDGHVNYNYFVQDHQDTKNVHIMINDHDDIEPFRYGHFTKAKQNEAMKDN